MIKSRSAKDVEREILTRYRQRTKASRAAHQEAVKVLPAGDTRASTLYHPYPTYMVRGEGVWLYDDDGNRYLDLLNNYTSLIHGHAQPQMVEEAADQLTRGSVFGSAAGPQLELAQLLCERIASIDQLRFTNSGTEATMMMMRTARAVTGKDVIVKIDGGYHGSHDFANVNVSADIASDGQPQPQVEGRGVPGAVVDATLVAPFNDLDAMEKLLRRHGSRIAGIIVEPLPNSGGMVPPDPGYLRGLRALADAHDVLLLFDEVVSLRLSRGGQQELAGVRPDLTALGKIIGGGFPVGAFGGKKALMDLYNPASGDDFLQHSGTFNGNNITMTAGLAAMRELDQAAIDRINSLGEALNAGIQGIFQSRGIRAQCLGYGSLQQIQWTDAPVKNLGDAQRASQDLGKLPQLFHLELLNRGVYCSTRGMFCIATPAGGADIDLALAAIDGAMDALHPYISQVAPRLL